MIQLSFLFEEVEVEPAQKPAAPLRLEAVPAVGALDSPNGWRLSGVWPHRDLRAARRQVDAYLALLDPATSMRCLFTGRAMTVAAWRASFREPVTVANTFEGRHALVEGRLFARLFGLYQLGESDVVLVADADTDVADVYEVLSAWASYRLASAEDPKWDRPFPFGFGLLSFAEYDVGDADFWALMRDSLGSQHLRRAFDERMEAPAPRVFIEAEDAADPDTGYTIGVAATLSIRKRQRATVARLVDFYEEGGAGWLAALHAATNTSPNAQDAAGACERLASRPAKEWAGGQGDFFAYREESRGPLDSGWRLGCLDPDHVHDDASLRILPLGQLARGPLVDYLGLPAGWAVTFEDGRFWTTPPGESRSFPDERNDERGGDRDGPGLPIVQLGGEPS